MTKFVFVIQNKRLQQNIKEIRLDIILLYFENCHLYGIIKNVIFTSYRQYANLTTPGVIRACLSLIILDTGGSIIIILNEISVATTRPFPSVFG
jgi:hypothetical protein